DLADRVSGEGLDAYWHIGIREIAFGMGDNRQPYHRDIMGTRWPGASVAGIVGIHLPVTAFYHGSSVLKTATRIGGHVIVVGRAVGPFRPHTHRLTGPRRNGTATGFECHTRRD